MATCVLLAKVFLCIWFADQLSEEVYSKEGAERQVGEMQKPVATHGRIQPVKKKQYYLLYLVLQPDWSCT